MGYPLPNTISPMMQRANSWVENGCIIVCPDQKKKLTCLGSCFFVHKCLADELKAVFLSKQSLAMCVWKIHSVTYRKSFFLRNGLDLGILRQENSIENMSCENENHQVFVARILECLEDRFGFPFIFGIRKMLIIWERFNDIKVNSQ